MKKINLKNKNLKYIEELQYKLFNSFLLFTCALLILNAAFTNFVFASLSLTVWYFIFYLNEKRFSLNSFSFSKKQKSEFKEKKYNQKREYKNSCFYVSFNIITTVYITLMGILIFSFCITSLIETNTKTKEVNSILNEIKINSSATLNYKSPNIEYINQNIDKAIVNKNTPLSELNNEHLNLVFNALISLQEDLLKNSMSEEQAMYTAFFKELKDNLYNKSFEERKFILEQYKEKIKDEKNIKNKEIFEKILNHFLDQYK